MPGIEPTKTKFLYINRGRLNFVNKLGNGTDEWKSHGGWTGRLTNVSFKWVEPKEKKPYEAINIHLNDGQENVIITCKFNSGYGRAFAKAIGNADLSQPITVVPNYKEDGEKKEGTIFIQQNGATIKWLFTRDNPGGMPAPKEVDMGEGQKVYVFTDQLQFLKDYIISNIVPKLEHPLMAAGSDITGTEMTSSMKPPSLDPEEMEADDLPF